MSLFGEVLLVLWGCCCEDRVVMVVFVKVLDVD